MIIDSHSHLDMEQFDPEIAHADAEIIRFLINSQGSFSFPG